MSEWIDSLERAIEVTEGQIALSKAIGAPMIGVDLERAQKLIDCALPLTELERSVVEKAIAWRYQACSRNKIEDELWDACNQLIEARQK